MDNNRIDASYFHPAAASIFGIILAMATLKSSYSDESFWMVGQAFQATLFLYALLGIILLVLLLGIYPPWRKSSILPAWIAMFAVYSINLLLTRRIEGIYILFQLLMIFCLFSFISSVRWSTLSIYWYSLSFTLTLFVGWAAASHAASNPLGILPANTNTISYLSFMGIISCCLGFISSMKYLSRVYFVLFAIICVAFLINSSSRSIWMAAIAFIVCFILYSTLLRYWWLHTLCFLGILIFIAFCVYINVYEWREEIAVEQRLSDINEALTGKSMSTRSRIWKDVIDVIMEKPLLGIGLGGKREELVLSETLSCHSGYLQIGLQTGVIGIVAFISLLYSIGLVFGKSANDYRFGRIGYALIMSLLLHEGFETSLTENVLTIGAVAWTLVAICLEYHLAQAKITRDKKQVTYHL
jgi:O-antigen ligase